MLSLADMCEYGCRVDGTCSPTRPHSCQLEIMTRQPDLPTCIPIVVCLETYHYHSSSPPRQQLRPQPTSESPIAAVPIAELTSGIDATRRVLEQTRANRSHLSHLHYLTYTHVSYYIAVYCIRVPHISPHVHRTHRSIRLARVRPLHPHSLVHQPSRCFWFARSPFYSTFPHSIATRQHCSRLSCAHQTKHNGRRVRVRT
jgi:hypothetical protein